MKLFCFGLLALGCSFALRAQTNPSNPAMEMLSASSPIATNTPAGTNALNVLPPPIVILGDKTEVNIKSNIAVYTGHAGIDYPDMQVRCWVLRFEVPRLTISNYNRVTAESNVVIDYWKTNHATADRAVVTKTLSNGVANILVQLIGNACVTNPMGSITGANWVIWDPINQTMGSEGGKTTFQPGEHDMASPFGVPLQTRTNSPVKKNSSPPIKPQIHP
jgi:hypothetical protein